MRDREFAATLLMGRMRENAEALGQDAQLLALFPSDTTWQNTSQRLTALNNLADSLSRMVLPSETVLLKDAVRDVALRAPNVLRLATAGRTVAADSLLDRSLSPAMDRLDRAVATVESKLQERTRQTVESLRTEASIAQRNSAIGLAVSLSRLAHRDLAGTLDREASSGAGSWDAPSRGGSVRLHAEVRGQRA